MKAPADLVSSLLFVCSLTAFFSALFLVFFSSRFRVVFEIDGCWSWWRSYLRARGMGGLLVKIPFFRYCGNGGKAVPLQRDLSSVILKVLTFNYSKT